VKSPPVTHWDEVEAELNEVGPLSGRWRDLGEAAGSETVGVQRIDVTPGKRSTPLHVELAEEETHYVLRGSGLSWQFGGEEHRTYEVRAGDCLVHRIEEEAHTLIAGPDGLDVLAFGMREGAGGTYLPRAGVVRVPPAWVEMPGGPHPWKREAAAPEVDLPEPGGRAGRVVNRDEVEPEEIEHGESSFTERTLAPEARLTGLNLHEIRPGKRNWPFHCHTAEEEIFIVLGGAGEVRIGDEQTPVREGSVVARPAGTGVAHAFYAGDEGLTLLAYGTHDRRDIAWYPEAGKVNFRGLGFTARVEPLDYWDGL
jgi:uncharacterized cupin superfamily protein